MQEGNQAEALSYNDNLNGDTEREIIRASAKQIILKAPFGDPAI